MDDIKNLNMADRLDLVADELYSGNMSELARALDMKPPSFYKYVNGERRPGTTVLQRLTRLGINLHWLLTGEGQMLQSAADRLSPLPLTSQMAPSFVEIENSGEILHSVPLLRVITDEKGAPRLEEKGAAEWLSETFIEKNYGVDPELLKAFRVSGDAMQESLRAGDRARGILWKNESLSDGAIYVFHREPGAVIFRRVRFNGDQILLTAEHPEVPKIFVETGAWNNRFRPVAQIVECVRAL